MHLKFILKISLLTIFVVTAGNAGDHLNHNNANCDKKLCPNNLYCTEIIAPQVISLDSPSNGANIIWDDHTDRKTVFLNGNVDKKDAEVTAKTQSINNTIKEIAVDAERKESAEGKTKVLMAVIAGVRLHKGDYDDIQACYKVVDVSDPLYGHYQVLKLTQDLAIAACRLGADLVWNNLYNDKKADFDSLDDIGGITKEIFTQMFNFVGRTHNLGPVSLIDTNSIITSVNIVPESVIETKDDSSVEDQDYMHEGYRHKNMLASNDILILNQETEMLNKIVRLVKREQSKVEGDEIISDRNLKNLKSNFNTLIKRSPVYKSLSNTSIESLDERSNADVKNSKVKKDIYSEILDDLSGAGSEILDNLNDSSNNKTTTNNQILINNNSSLNTNNNATNTIDIDSTVSCCSKESWDKWNFGWLHTWVLPPQQQNIILQIGQTEYTLDELSSVNA